MVKFLSPVIAALLIFHLAECNPSLRAQCSLWESFLADWSTDTSVFIFAAWESLPSARLGLPPPSEILFHFDAAPQSTTDLERFDQSRPCDILETGICCLSAVSAQQKWLTVWWILCLNRWNSPELQGRGSPAMYSALCLAWTGVLKALKRNRSSGSLSNASHLFHCQAARVFEMDDIQVVESKPLLEIPVRILKKHRWHSCWGSALHDHSQLFLFISDAKIQILLQTLTAICF